MPTVTFIGTDTTTQGSWIGVYGSSGYYIANWARFLNPGYPVSFVGSSLFTWNGGTSDTKALQKPDAGDRIASSWFAGTSFYADVDVQFPTQQHIHLYCLDWDAQGRSETIDVLDASDDSVIDTRTVSSFSGGKWLSWDVTGHVKFRITKTAGPNAVLSGIMFDEAGSGGNARTSKEDALPLVTSGGFARISKSDVLPLVQSSNALISKEDVLPLTQSSYARVSKEDVLILRARPYAGGANVQIIMIG